MSEGTFSHIADQRSYPGNVIVIDHSAPEARIKREEEQVLDRAKVYI